MCTKEVFNHYTSFFTTLLTTLDFQKRVYDLTSNFSDFPETASKRLKNSEIDKKKARSKCSWLGVLAEKGGFEPPRPLFRPAPLAGVCIRPLCHFSAGILPMFCCGRSSAHWDTCQSDVAPDQICFVLQVSGKRSITRTEKKSKKLLKKVRVRFNSMKKAKPPMNHRRFLNGWCGWQDSNPRPSGS